MMHISEGERRLKDLRVPIRSWLALWGVPGLDKTLTIEWSSRLQSSLGRAFPSRRLVRLSPLLIPAGAEVALEAVCHELAHVAVSRLHRSPCRPHGPEWARLVRAAGFPIRIRVPFDDKTATRSAGTRAVTRLRPAIRIYVHTCPVCHLRRLARRRISRWRCAACVGAGLDGRLDIEARAGSS